MIQMKHSKLMATVTLLFLGVSGAAGQSLGDYARTVRKNKPETSSATRHFDNDNLPTDQAVSIVGPPPTSNATADNSQAAKAAVDPAAAAAERQKAADEWNKKLDTQKAKIDALRHELDLEQREYRLKEAAFYGDAGTRLRDAAQFDKQDSDYKNDVDSKQKAIESAKQALADLQEQARKAGITEKEEKDADKDSAKDVAKDKDKDK
jgi:hypothetical protein